jgi:hypothetical protein
MRKSLKNKFSILFILSTIFLFNLSLRAQDSTNFKKQTIVRLHFIIPGFGIEQGIKKDMSCVFDLGTGYSSFVNEDENGNKVRESYFNPYFKIEPRYFFDIKKRESLGSRTDFYSGAYAGAIIRLGIPYDKLDFWYSFGPILGFQKTLGKRFYWNISVGLGAQSYHNITKLGTMGEIAIGVIFNKIKK